MLDTLPPELIAAVLSFLPIGDILSARLVCQALNHTIEFYGATLCSRVWVRIRDQMTYR